jgi:hypothetical protein
MKTTITLRLLPSLLTALVACSAAQAPELGEGSVRASEQALRALLPAEVAVAPAPLVPTDVVYTGTTMYQSFRFSLTAQADVSATVEATVPGRKVLGWITDGGAQTFAAPSVGAKPALTVAARLVPGTYFIVFRDSERLATTLRIGLTTTPVTPVTPPPPPPSAGPSILLPPGKNGAPAHAVYTFVYKFSIISRPRKEYAQVTATKTCAGRLVENGRTIKFFPGAPCTQTITGEPGFVANERIEETMDQWYYDADKDRYSSGINGFSGIPLEIFATSALARTKFSDIHTNGFGGPPGVQYGGVTVDRSVTFTY